jgi:formate dehydrogenase iron-sulfur subunit
VSGTHVMYVLHHADKPSIYAGLPDKPQISAFVGLWKGIVKPVALAGLAFTALAGFFHWITFGPNDVQPEDEAKAQDLLHRVDEQDELNTQPLLQPADGDEAKAQRLRPVDERL